ncbi:hypothetical protein AM493_07755 [Flavobacterium akiainvivens]|uniref:Outer membrane protein beta-barrel domain-containing protein n=1 Tax=Flavobacterium akiainvivens TaxID=1202724 RepID=A0A0M8MGT5_9FLAO|nr:hypothetical protein [Flavobacterium akiainvivens]KOS05941.1 hypothetical protein AM493_07755 [Flavobacterium akiainvivens]SFQ53469.1 hypothetical protein SAMN05444144_10730 [Flavobacterium akiainvivens]
MKKTLLAFLLFAASPFCALAQNTETFDVSDHEKIMVSASGFYSYRLANIQNGYTGAFREHMKQLRQGYSYQASAYYMFNYRAGAGLEFNSFKASDTMPGTHDVTAPNGQTGNSRVSDDITISFYGAGLIFNIFQEKRQKLYFHSSFGYMRFSNKAFVIDDYKITGGGLGTSISLTYQYLLFEDFSVGPKINFTGASLRRFTYKGPDGFTEKVKLPSDDREQLMRIEAGVQLMYRF